MSKSKRNKRIKRREMTQFDILDGVRKPLPPRTTVFKDTRRQKRLKLDEDEAKFFGYEG